MPVMEPRKPKPTSSWVPITPHIESPEPDQYLRKYSHQLAFANVISALERTQRGWEHHISVSVMGQRPDEHIVEIMKRDFDAYDFEEDNHNSVHARHFWKPLERDKEGECECKSEGS